MFAVVDDSGTPVTNDNGQYEFYASDEYAESQKAIYQQEDPQGKYRVIEYDYTRAYQKKIKKKR